MIDHQADSAMSVDSDSSDNLSITSSTNFFRESGGRRYHNMGDNPYPFPSDGAEETRLDSVQDMIMILYGTHVLVPIRNLPNTEIVDLGTGSGRWAIEVADTFPNARVRGMDLAPMQPTLVPRNCTFYVGDIALDLGEAFFPTGSVDFVQLRQVHAGVQREQWQGIIDSIFRMLKPGIGWIQCGEVCQLLIDSSVQPPSKSALWQYWDWMFKFHDERGTCIQTSEQQKGYLEKAGFVDIQVFKKVIDMGCYSHDPVARRAGRVARFAYGAVMPMAGMWAAQIEDIDERRAFNEKALNEFRGGESPVALAFHQIIARKPPVIMGPPPPRKRKRPTHDE